MERSSSVSVPDTLEEAMSPEWLSAALGLRFPAITVTSATRGPIVSRVSTNARFEIACEDDLPDGLPAHLCIKGYFTDCSETAVLEPGGRRAGGALSIASWLRTARVRTLRAFYADVDPVTHHGVVISEDVVEEGAVFLDALSVFSPDQAAQSLEQYAVLHGRTWGRDQLADPGYHRAVDATLRARGVPEIRGNFDGPIGAGVPAEIRDADRLVRVVGSSRGCCPPPSRAVCSMATPTSAICTSTPLDARAWWIGNWSSAGRGISTWATTSHALSGSKTVVGPNETF